MAYPWGGGGSCIGADIPQKYFSLNIGGKNEILSIDAYPNRYFFEYDLVN